MKIQKKEIFEQFNETIKYIDGKYEVKLPLKNNNKEKFADNKEITYKRLKNLASKFRKDSVLIDRYKGVLEDYLKDRIIEIVSQENVQNEGTIYHIPHHAIIREGKSTSLRILFNASSHSEGNLSLNDCLNSEHNLNPQLLDLLIKFRQNKIAFTSDVKQAFLNIWLNEVDRNVARFLWIENPFITEELQEVKIFVLLEYFSGFLQVYFY